MKNRLIQQAPSFLGVLKIALAACIWGIAYPLTKGALKLVPPITLGFLRFLLASSLLMVYTRSRPLQGVTRSDRRTFWGLGFWGTFVLILGMNFGLKWAPGVIASIISGTPPLFAVFLAAFMLGEPLKFQHLAAIALAVPGLVLLAGDTTGAGGETWEIWVGCLLVTIPQFSWAMYGILGKRCSARYDWSIVCRDTFALGTMLLFVPTLFEVWHQGLGTWTSATWFTLLYLGSLNSVVTYGLWNSALKVIPVSTANFVLYLQPVSGAILSMFLFGESLGSSGWIGTGLVFTALALVLRCP